MLDLDLQGPGKGRGPGRGVCRGGLSSWAQAGRGHGTDWGPQAPPAPQAPAQPPKSPGSAPPPQSTGPSESLARAGAQ